jgi:hypothetical protein
MQLGRGEEVEMNRLVKKLGKYNVAALTIMVVGVVLFLLAPTGWGVGWDSDILGFFLFVIGLLMLVVGLVVRRVRSNFWKGVVVGVIATVVIGALIGVVVYNNCATPASVATSAATGVTANSATLDGDLTDLNDVVAADVSFQWGTTSLNDSKSYPNETEARAIDTAGKFTYDLTGLTSNTTYYYRAKADSGNYGTTYGDESSFTTP